MDLSLGSSTSSDAAAMDLFASHPASLSQVSLSSISLSLDYSTTGSPKGDLLPISNSPCFFFQGLTICLLIRTIGIDIRTGGLPLTASTLLGQLDGRSVP